MKLMQLPIQPWNLPMTFQMDYWTPNVIPMPPSLDLIYLEIIIMNSDKWFINSAYARLKMFN